MGFITNIHHNFGENIFWYFFPSASRPKYIPVMTGFAICVYVPLKPVFFCPPQNPSPCAASKKVMGPFFQNLPERKTVSHLNLRCLEYLKWFLSGAFFPPIFRGVSLLLVSGFWVNLHPFWVWNTHWNFRNVRGKSQATDKKTGQVMAVKARFAVIALRLSPRVSGCRVYTGWFIKSS